jgi:hypothetical protein
MDEEKYLDVLQNLEFGIILVYREDRKLLDYDAQEAIDGLVRIYAAEERGYSPPALRLSERAQRVFDSVKGMSEWRLGRATFPGEAEGPEDEMVSKPHTVAEILLCLRRISKSIRLWTKEAGRHGYLNYIDQFLI